MTGLIKSQAYILTNIQTGQAYIGSTSRDLKKRFLQHFHRKNDGESKLKVELRKFPLKEFWTIEALFVSFVVDGAEEVEEALIAAYDTYHNGLNSTLHGKLANRIGSIRSDKNWMTGVGSSHPLHGKKRSNSTKALIRTNHAPCNSILNSNAKHLQIVSPCGLTYECNGNLKNFCKSMNIPLATMIKLRRVGEIKRGPLRGWKTIDCGFIRDKK